MPGDHGRDLPKGQQYKPEGLKRSNGVKGKNLDASVRSDGMDNMKKMQMDRANKKHNDANAIIEHINVTVDMRTMKILKCEMPVMDTPVVVLTLLNKLQEMLMSFYECKVKEKSPILQPKPKKIITV